MAVVVAFLFALGNSTKFHGTVAAFIVNMFEFELLVPTREGLLAHDGAGSGSEMMVDLDDTSSFKKEKNILLASCMEINPAHIARHLVKADVVEPFKTRT